MGDNEQNNQLHFQLETEPSISHGWYKPAFEFLSSDHCSGRHFFNPIKRPNTVNKSELFKWLLTRKSKTWTVDADKERHELFPETRPLPINRPDADLDDWQIWFIGHATVLIQIGPYNFLTDPVWCKVASPFKHRGPERVIPAGIALEELPHIDAVLLSHNHYDHMDLASLAWLHEHFAMPIYTGLGNANYLPKNYNVTELDWWQDAEFEGIEIIYTPAQHGSGRGLRDQNQALWGGFSLRMKEGHFFFAGDTGYSPHFKEIKQRLGAPRVALLPIGAYEPRRILQYLHMNPHDALQAHQDLHAQCSVAIHYRTFQLTDEARDLPEQELHDAIMHSSKLISPFYCIREGRKLIV